VAGDQPQIVRGTLPAGPADTFDLLWDISNLEAGEYDLVLTVTDELGYQGVSAAVPARITFDRPSPATAEPPAAPISETLDVLENPPAVPVNNSPWLDGRVGAALAAGALLVITAVFWRNRGRLLGGTPAGEPVTSLESMNAENEGQGGETLSPRLEPFSGSSMEPVGFLGDNVTIGRTSGLADVVIAHPSLAHLHARIRHQDSEYWLFDEGSVEGTYLNYERLGLAPRMLKDGDVVQFGTVSYHFHLRPPGTYGEVLSGPVVELSHAIVLDMDGLMVDTEPLSRQAWDQVLAELGCEPLDDAFYRSLIGRRLRETAETIADHYGLALEPSELAWRKEAAFSEIRDAGIPVLPGLYELLSVLDQRDICWGVATSTPRHIAEQILSQIGVLESCQALAAGDEVANGKPAPDVYLLAAERLHAPADHCLAIEDSTLGCQAARAAGMTVIAIPDRQDPIQDFGCADHIMTSLLDVVGRLDELLAELKR
jgi:HAD superfamily hydrolase (TIGR01509 family)